MFQLTNREKLEVVTNCGHPAHLKYSYQRSHAFTEHGALMLANVLRSPRAVQASILVVRAFIRIREILYSNQELAKRLNDLEKKYDAQFKVVFDAIRQLMDPPAKPHHKIAFHP